MRTADIQPGRTYRVRLSEQQSVIYLGCDVVATVVRAGFHYEVETVTGSAVRGAPFRRSHESVYPNGVEVRWETQRVYGRRRHQPTERCHAGRAIVNARAVLWEDDRIEGVAA